MKGGMQGMLKQVQKMQAEMQKVQSELANMTVSEEAGGGMIKATANGSKEIISVEIDPAQEAINITNDIAPTIREIIPIIFKMVEIVNKAG